MRVFLRRAPSRRLRRRRFVLPSKAALTHYTLTADAAAFTLTGQDASLERGLLLTAAAGSYTLTGQAATFPRTYVLAADAGSFVLTGQAASLKKGFVLAAGAGAFALTGQAASLEIGYLVSAGVGVFTLTGQAATLNKGFTLTAAAGAFTLTGQAASIEYGRIFSVDVGAYVVDGQSANLIGAGRGPYRPIGSGGGRKERYPWRETFWDDPEPTGKTPEELEAEELVRKRRKASVLARAQELREERELDKMRDVAQDERRDFGDRFASAFNIAERMGWDRKRSR